jgi:hypothetical protein
MKPSLDIHVSYKCVMSNLKLELTFRHALLVRPGMKNAMAFHWSTSPWMETAWIRSLSSSADHGVPVCAMHQRPMYLTLAQYSAMAA